MGVRKITITMDEVLIQRIDQLVAEKRFASRNDAVQAAVREKFGRREDGRLARELAKLDVAFEQKMTGSPFDVPTVALPVTTDEIVQFVRESRREGYGADSA